MIGSLYPNGVLVDHSALKNTELTKAAEILRNRTAITSRGVYSGFAVTFDPIDATRITVAIGTGFTPRGDYLATTSSYFSIVLADSALNAINYVCAVYSETNTFNASHESDGAVYPTRSEMSWRIRVYTEAGYLALAATDANLANDARDRMIVLAHVTGEGGNPLTASDFTGPFDYYDLLYATPSELTTLVGVTIVSATSSTAAGAGTVSYTYAVGPVYTLTWTPAAGGAGAAVPITADGYYNLLDGLGNWIRVYVVLSQLPTTGTFPMTETVTITNLYYQAIPRFTGEDVYHRNLVGTGVLSRQNPHALSISDIAGDALPQLEEHEDVMHCNGIWRSASPGVLTCVRAPSVSGDRLDILAPLPSDLYYINGNKLNSISNTSILFYTWLPEWGAAALHLQTNFFEIYVTPTGEVEAHCKASYPSGRHLTGTWIVDMSDEYPAGNYNLWYTTSGLYTQLRWDAGPIVSVLTADFGVSGNGRVVRLYNVGGGRWIDLWVNMDDPKGGGDDHLFNNTAGPWTDVISVTTSPDWDTNMQIASLVYWWDATAAGIETKLGYGTAAPFNRVIDKRPFGTTCTHVMSDSALQAMTYDQQDELHYSGILFGRYGTGSEFQVGAAVFPTLSIYGGSYYCRGRRITVKGFTATPLPDNTTSLVWLDMAGTAQILDIADFGGNMQDAMAYVLGGPAGIPAIDGTSHFTDLVDPPERGVLLYAVVTSGGAISYYEDISRNVNGPVDPWSVASRSATTTLGRSAAFNSLYAAFAYADLFNRMNDITIRVIGYTEINNARIVQPVGVTVTGAKQTVSKIVVNYAVIAGVWCLGSGCKVSNVDITLGANSTSVFGLCTALVATSDDVTIEDCRFDCTVTYTTNTSFLIIGEAGFAGSSCNNLIVQGNRVTAGASFVRRLLGTLDLNNITIRDNFVAITGTSATAAIYLFSDTMGANLNVVGNGIAARSGLHVINAVSCKVSNNSIGVGYSSTGDSYGIRLEIVANTDVADNSLQLRSGTASLDHTGIILGYTLACAVHHNTIISMQQGITDLGVLASTSLIVDNNIISAVDNGAGVGGVGIATYANNVTISNNEIYAEAAAIGCGPAAGATNVSILGNMITVLTVNADPEPLQTWGVGLGGCSGITIAAHSVNVLVADNEVHLWGVPVGVGGVLADLSVCIQVPTAGGFDIKDNVTSVMCSSLSGAGGAMQIVASPDVLLSCSYSITNNRIDNRTHIGAGIPSPVFGLLAVGAVSISIIGKISGNQIDGSRTNFDVGSPYELYINAFTSWLIFSDNVVSAIDSAIPMSHPKYEVTPAAAGYLSGGNNRELSGVATSLF